MQNPVISLDMLRSTVSQEAGFTSLEEHSTRIHACILVRNCCTLLKLPQNTSATAQTLLQRFYFVVSIGTIPLFDLVAAAVYLATKLEETHVRLKDLVLAMDQQCIPRQNIQFATEDYFDFRNGIIQAEISILAKLGFNVHVESPHGYLFNYISSLNLDTQFAQNALEYLNDSLATIVHCLYQPFIIACGIIYLTCSEMNHALPVKWFKVFDAEEEDLDIIAKLVLQLYSMEPVKLEHYNKLVPR